jgi:serine phosphatase RsbU (regulator of sigma subunit)
LNGYEDVEIAGRTGEDEPAWRGSLSYIAEASDLLAGTLQEQHVRVLAAQLIVPRLAVWCAVYATSEDDQSKAQLRPRCVWHTDEERAEELAARLAAAGPPPIPDTPGHWSDNGFRIGGDQAYLVPLVARGRRLGVIVLGGETFGLWALDLAEELGRRTALAIDNARLYAAQASMSRALQHSLLPPALPEIPGVEVAVKYEAAGDGAEVGGDFYDLFVAGEREGQPCWRFAIGDVCGTGPEAAAVTGLARHTLRILGAEGMPIPDVLSRLNRLILAEGPRARLMTLVHGEIIQETGGGLRMGLVCAGHPPPLVLAKDGEVREIGTPQALLGVFDDLTYGWDLVSLSVGDVMLCVTDGVTERRNGDLMLGDEGGLEELLQRCTGLSAGAVAARIQRAVQDYATTPVQDDMALFVLRVS